MTSSGESIMIEYVLILWITISAGDSGYITTPKEIGTYHMLDRCEVARDLLVETTKAEEGAVVAVCLARDK